MNKNATAAKTAQTESAPVTAGPGEQPLKIVSHEKESPKIPGIEELKDRALTLHLLRTKHDSLTEKRKRLEHFAIVHDRDNARISVVDAQGEEFKSSSPKSIARLIDFWKDEFRDAIEEVEREMVKVFN